MMTGFQTPPEWTARAACAETFPDEFFPSQGESPKRAKLICAQCDVRAECLSAALEGREQGVWGGTTEAERDLILRGGAA